MYINNPKIQKLTSYLKLHVVQTTNFVNYCLTNYMLTYHLTCCNVTCQVL